MNIFNEVKKRVTAKMAAEHYGLRIKANGSACCPFHDDKHPSMVIGKGYHCYTCGAKGDVIDYVAKLFEISNFEAVTKLNKDFSLGIRIDPVKKKERTNKNMAIKKERSIEERSNFVRKKLDAWIDHAWNVLVEYLKWLQFWREFYEPDMDETWNPLFEEALNHEEMINYLLDTLYEASGEELIQFFYTKRGDVEKYEKRITDYRSEVIDEVRKYCSE